MRDTIGLTLSTIPGKQENLDGMAYSQFYPNIKTPFDVSKVYVFDNEALDNLALDPGYVQSLQLQGGGAAFSARVVQKSYLHSKGRAFASLRDNQRRSYGVREEHRVTLTIMDEICEQWQEWELEGTGPSSSESPLPYYVVPSPEMFRFLSAQINKYCLLFEHTLAHTARTYSLPETMVMVIALRALRFCYGSNLLSKEALLYKDRWETNRGGRFTVHEGLGMKETMARTGFGWFLPKFNWTHCRIIQPSNDNMLVGNFLMHAEYKRRWAAVKDLKDVFVRFSQAIQWFHQHSVKQNPQLLATWLEYLHALILEQFDADIWASMLAIHKRRPELSPLALEGGRNMAFCMRDMAKLFLPGGIPSPPHIATGNRSRFGSVEEVLDYIFLDNGPWKRKGWQDKPFRMVMRKSIEFLRTELPKEQADAWIHEFMYLAQLTHWILPYPSETALIDSTKTSASQGLVGRMMWISCVYTGPVDIVPGQGIVSPEMLSGPSKNVSRLLARAHIRSRRPTSPNHAWGAQELMKACRRQGMLMLGQDQTPLYWDFGRVRSKGTWVPIWERGIPPTLAMQKRIRDKSMDELDGLMAEFIHEAGPAGREQAPLRILPPAAPAAPPAARSNSGSIFVPSVDSN